MLLNTSSGAAPYHSLTHPPSHTSSHIHSLSHIFQCIPLDTSSYTPTTIPSYPLIYPLGEAVDAIEHFFWGRTNGLVLELGAGDGLPSTASVSYPLEKRLGWRRILVEGNPKFQEILRDQSSEALIVVRTSIYLDLPPLQRHAERSL